MTDPVPPDSIIEYFRLHEEAGEELDEALAKRLFRSCLVHIFSDNPPEDLLKFLKSPMPGSERVVNSSPVASPSVPPPAAIPLMSDGFAQSLIALLLGKDLDEFLTDLPSEVSAFMTGLQAALKGQAKEAQAVLESLPRDGVAFNRLAELINSLEAQPLKERPTGISFLPIDSFEGDFDEARDEVIGYCTKSDPPKAVFIQPLMIRRGGSIGGLSKELRRRLFPQNGDVMAFPGAGYPRQPRHGEVGIWKVSEHDTDKATHFHLSVETQKIYEVVGVPFPSTDYDSVREYLKEHGSHSGETQRIQAPLFVLSDGTILGLRPEKGDLSKDETYDLGLLRWNTLQAIRTEGRIFVAGPLPKEHGVYECIPISNVVRKVLRPYVGSGRFPGGITKAQLSELTQLFATDDAALTHSRIQRIRAELRQIESNQELLTVVVNELFADKTVTQRVEELVHQAAIKQSNEKAEVLSDIARLKKEREEWEEKVRKQKDEHKKLREDTSKVVRSAFEKARAEGVGTLAEVAIFQELVGSTSRHVNGGQFPVSQGFQPRTWTYAKESTDMASVLGSVGIGSRKSAAILQVGELATSEGLILCVRGFSARLVVECWAKTLGDGIGIEGSVGLIDDSKIQALLEELTGRNSVAVLDANLSSVDIYARPLCDALVARLASRNDRGSIAVLLSISDALGALPIPRSIEKIAITVDLDASYDFNRDDVEQLMERAFNPDDGLLMQRLWRPAYEKIQKRVLEMKVEDRVQVLSLLV